MVLLEREIKRTSKGSPVGVERSLGGGGLNSTPAVGGDLKADWWGCTGP